MGTIKGAGPGPGGVFARRLDAPASKPSVDEGVHKSDAASSAPPTAEVPVPSSETSALYGGGGVGAPRGPAQLLAHTARIPPKQSTEVVYSPTVERFAELSEKALDVVDGPYGQRARRKERAGRGEKATYKQVMSEVQRDGLAVLVPAIKERLKAAHEELGVVMSGPPALQHLSPVRHDAVLKLEPWEQKMLTNGAGRFCGSWFEVDSYVHNALSMAMHRSMKDDATIDPSKLRAELGDAAVDVLERATQAFGDRDVAQQHWQSGEISPYEPDDRPVTKSDLLSLRFKDRALHDALIEAAPIPEALPVLDVSANADDVRLDDYHVVMVQHALGSIVPFTDKLVQKGVRPDDIEFVTVPYSTNAIVEKKLEDKGLNVHNSCPDTAIAPRDVETVMERDVFRALQQATKKAEASGKKLLVIDDGGIVVRLMAGRAKTLGKPKPGDIGLPADGYREWVMKHRDMPVQVVEQTTRGITEAKKVGSLPAGVTLVDMARSRAKAFEGPMVGRDAHVVLDKALRDMGRGGLDGKEIVVIGYGVIGSAVAKSMREAGAKVVVADIGDEARERAEADGFVTFDQPAEALEGKDMVVGCSGHRSVRHEDFFKLKRGAVLASLSSKAMELFTDHLEGRMSPNMYPLQGHGEAPVSKYGRAFQHHQVVENNPNDKFSQAVYYLVNNGCPATFTGKVNCVPPEDIQLTEAIKLEAVMQAVRAPYGEGLVALEEDRQDRVLDAMDTYREGWRDMPDA
jgi:predicted dinucleotide-utilizing enzyme